VIHAYLFRGLFMAFSGGTIKQGLKFAGLVFVMTFLFWEFFTPFNLFGEPLPLIALELVFWACIAAFDGLVIAAMIGGKSSKNARNSND
jgi:hypothetical protein